MSELKELDLTWTLFTTVEKYPELLEIFQEVGLKGASNPITRKTVGKKVTLIEGTKLNHIPLKDFVERLEKEGYVIVARESYKDVL